MVGKPWSLTANGVSLTIRLTPKGGRDAIDGVDVLADGRLSSRCGSVRRQATAKPTLHMAG